MVLPASIPLDCSSKLFQISNPDAGFGGFANDSVDARLLANADPAFAGGAEKRYYYLDGLGTPEGGFTVLEVLYSGTPPAGDGSVAVIAAHLYGQGTGGTARTLVQAYHWGAVALLSSMILAGHRIVQMFPTLITENLTPQVPPASVLPDPALPPVGGTDVISVNVNTPERNFSYRKPRW